MDYYFFNFFLYKIKFLEKVNVWLNGSFLEILYEKVINFFLVILYISHKIDTKIFLKWFINSLIECKFLLQNPKGKIYKRECHLLHKSGASFVINLLYNNLTLIFHIKSY